MVFERREDVAREAARARRAEVRHDYVTLDERWATSRAAAALARAVLADDDAIGREVDRLRDLSSSGMDDATSLVADTERDHDPDEHQGRRALEQIGARWLEVHDHLRAVDRSLDQLDRAVADVDRTRTACADRLRTLDGSLHSARAAVTTIEDRGFTTDDLRRALDHADEGHRRGRAALASDHLALAHRALSTATTEVERITATARGLPQRQADLTARTAEVQERATSAGLRLVAADGTLDRLRGRYGATVAAPVEGHLDTGFAALEEARGALVEATTAAGMDHQRFDDAEAHLDRGMRCLATSAAACDAVEASARQVEDVTARYPMVRAAAAAAMAQLGQFLDAHGYDIDPTLRRDVSTTTQLLADLDRRAGSGHADPFAVVHKLEEIQRWATEAALSAHADVQRRAAHRAQVEAVMGQARREVARARSQAGMGITTRSRQDHQTVQDAENMLAHAAQVLAVDPAQAEQLAHQAGAVVQRVLIARY